MKSTSPYTPLEIDYQKLTINGVQFPSQRILDDIADGITSNMYEGWRPTPKMIEMVRDLSLDRVSLEEFTSLVKAGLYE
jgi:putative transcriptional regulator